MSVVSEDQKPSIFYEVGKIISNSNDDVLENEACGYPVGIPIYSPRRVQKRTETDRNGSCPLFMDILFAHNHTFIHPGVTGGLVTEKCVVKYLYLCNVIKNFFPDNSPHLSL